MATKPVVPNTSGLSKRAALRQQQEQEEKARRSRRIMAGVLGAVAVVVIAILAVTIFQTLNKSTDEALTPAELPPNATSLYGIGIPSNGTKPTGDVPHVVIYEDYQCPACAWYEQNYGPVLEKLVDSGKVTTEIISAHFLDLNLKNDSSERAALAATAADAVGKYREYHTVVYANQPANEGTGYTDEQLRVEFPAKAGITGDNLTKFQQIYDQKTYQKFVDRAQGQFQKDKIGGTPTYMVKGTKLLFSEKGADGQMKTLIEPTEEAFLKAITDAANK